MGRHAGQPQTASSSSSPSSWHWLHICHSKWSLVTFGADYHDDCCTVKRRTCSNSPQSVMNISHLHLLCSLSPLPLSVTLHFCSSFLERFKIASWIFFAWHAQQRNRTGSYWRAISYEENAIILGLVLPALGLYLKKRNVKPGWAMLNGETPLAFFKFATSQTWCQKNVWG